MDTLLNKAAETKRLNYLKDELFETLSTVADSKKNPVFTTALIAGDCVILDAIAESGLLDRIYIRFIDTFHLFPESLEFLREVLLLKLKLEALVVAII